jgi:membrane protease subunit HflK
MPWDNKNEGPWNNNNNNNNNPWGKKSNNNGWNPNNKNDEFDKILNLYKEKLSNFFSKGPKSFFMGFIILVFLWLISGFYTISPEE